MRRMIPTKQIDFIKSIETADGKIDSSKLDKKLYYHPIYLYQRDELEGNILIGTITILDNNPTAYTTSTLAAKLKELMDAGAYIAFSGGFRATSNDDFNDGIIMLKEGASYQVVGISSDRSTAVSQTIDIDNLTAVSDGVNQIYP